MVAETGDKQGTAALTLWETAHMFATSMGHSIHLGARVRQTYTPFPNSNSNLPPPCRVMVSEPSMMVQPSKSIISVRDWTVALSHAEERQEDETDSNGQEYEVVTPPTLPLPILTL